MTTEPCKTCNGAGHVAGYWAPELCPACDGATEIPIADVPDKNTPGCLLVTAAFVAVCIGIGLWQFVKWVFA